MRRLSFIIVLILFAGKLSAQTSPHGKIQFDCSDCHISTSWKEIPSQKKFKHEATRFALVGQHKNVDCKQCHAILKFAEAREECASCHKDIHKNTVSQQCSNCHTPNAWLIENITDIHQRSRFPLLGQHAKADCQRCHLRYSELNFEPLGVKCYDCHKQNYAATQNPNHAQSGFSTECESCHNFTDAQWGYASFAHDFFPLQGGHKIVNCFSCHKAGTFAGLSKDCYSCHKTHFEQTKDPNHISAGFATACAICHTINGWKPASFDHTQYFVLEGAHTQLNCNKCHSTGFKNTPTDCYGCHKGTFEATTNPNHVTSKFPTDCKRCHTNTAWIPSSFNHSSTNFPLTGIHAITTCISCHASGYTNISTDCYSCHKTNYDNTTNPNHVTSQFPTTCNTCHSTTGWKPATFNHSTTQFPLTGAHLSVACIQCHASGYVNTPKDCYSCHKTNYDNTTNPNHVTSQFPTTCNTCHSTTAWKPATFDHSTTQFPLTGAHLSVACNQCHASGYVNTPKDCYSCHKTNYDNTTNPNHVTSQFPTTCTTCHSTTAWKPATFDHSTTTFPLTGAHTSVDCAKCHANGYTNTPTDCYSCHKTNYDNTTNPKHSTAGFPTTCKDCHQTTGWTPATFDHNKYFPIASGKHSGISCATCHNTSNYANFTCLSSGCHPKSSTDSKHIGEVNGYSYVSSECYRCHPTGKAEGAFNHNTSRLPLTGKHLTIACESCHLPTNTSPLSPECSSCHQTNYANSASPNHQQLGLSTDCKLCHTADGWKPSTFNHAATNFQLIGKHATAVCSDCHKGKTTGTSQVCNDCHQTNYANSLNPNHLIIGLSIDCKLCHTTDGWKPSTFNHATTNFQLVGKHATAVCSDCHKGKTTGTSQICNDCHQTNYANSLNPNHLTIGLSIDCKLCHTTDGWKPSTFNHATTNFQLVGKHLTAVCSDCHKGKTTGTSQICNDCHQPNYINSVNPSHQILGLSTDCKSCHTSDGWKPSTFNHATTNYQLVGKHTTATCSDCHKGKAAGTSQICNDCHQPNYASSVNPSHQILGLSTDCKSCHTPDGWKPSTFNHATTNYQLVGKHTTAACSDCHKGKAAGTSQICNDCHQPNYASSVNPNHLSIGLSTDCKSCHTTDGWKPSTFNHATTNFQLTGKHSTVLCSDCHKGKTTGTDTQCYGCHKTDYDNTTNPHHIAANFPTDCTKCHSTTAWKPATFDHSTTKFPLTGAHTSVDCVKCHTNGYTNTPTDCYSCHKTNYDNTTNPKHSTAGFTTACADCHKTAAWTPATFDHNKYFPIASGKHSGISCATCHNTSNYANFTCLSSGCHPKSSTDSKHIGEVNGYSYVSSECYRCHPTGRGDGAFNHSSSRLPLTGKHLTITCESCHLPTNTSPLSPECSSCHQTNYANSATPNHQQLGLSTDCKLCHTADGWKPSSFNHTATKFPLVGKHATAVCSDCHKGKTTGTSQICNDCHQTNYANSLNPNHQTLGLSTDCKSCHTSDGWKPSTFSHATTNYQLVGKHLTAACSDCHKGKAAGTSQICNDCHQTNYANSLNPNHQVIGLSTDCKSCHTTDGWKPSSFNHATTNFQLVGKHLTAVCSDCHKGKTTGTSQICVDCHQTNYTNSLNPNHQTLGLSTDCKSCHTTDGWKPSTFNHATTNFQLTGKHSTVVCSDCHKGKTTGTSQICNDCHQPNYANSLNPNHLSIGLSIDCKLCHTTDGWKPSTFNHATTSFPLIGGHTKAACSDCHKGKTTGTSQVCYDCHQLSFTNSVNPNHSALGISTDCKKCHTPTAWIPSSFSHSATNFQLTGGHAQAACSDCHKGKTTGTDTQCYSCHQSNFANAIDPNHTSLALPTTCQDCHTTQPGWKPASFSIHDKYYVIQGAHIAIKNNCKSCHVLSYANTPTLCYGCHQSNYNATTNPAHQTAQFPHDCETCHTQTAWTPSTFNHDGKYFPIYSGKHNREWNLCSDCHNSASNYKIFTCITCHEHSNKASVDKDHNGVKNYSYVSSECYRCHPTGRNPGQIKNFIKTLEN
ncbi:MAG: hypothetical protein M0P61_03070 [Ignavibacteriaceae bacterium]|jgi:nitrate/TMAO reductase-like tetraheme cytochrome c subunit|nr:hypothetical protein [Ignavibacteriaceae bacterium]